MFNNKGPVRLAASLAVAALLAMTGNVAEAAVGKDGSGQGNATKALDTPTRQFIGPQDPASCNVQRRLAQAKGTSMYLCITRINNTTGSSLAAHLGVGGLHGSSTRASVTNSEPYTAGSLQPIPNGPLNFPTSCGAASLATDKWAITDRFESCAVTDVNVTVFVNNANGTQTTIGGGQIAAIEWDELSNTSRSWDDWMNVNMYTAWGAMQEASTIAASHTCQQLDLTSHVNSSCGSVPTTTPTLLALNQPTYSRMKFANADRNLDQNSTNFQLTITNAAAANPATVNGNGIERMRCDNDPTWATTSGLKNGGCVHAESIPTLFYSTSDPAIQYTAAHVKKALADPSIYPVGDPHSQAPLHYDPSRQGVNRAAACGNFVPNPPDPVTGADSCDEFPFATTTEGCANTYTIGCSTAHVPLRDNTTAGSRLGSLYKVQRLLPHDAFYVVVS